MAKKLIVGQPFAYGFYSPDLHLAKASSTYAFAKLRPSPTVGWLGISRTVNILWRGSAMEVLQHGMFASEQEMAVAEARQRADIASVERRVEKEQPDATYRGLFTTTNVLVVKRIGGLRVVGPPVELEGFQDGPIKRIDPPRGAGARSRLLKLISSTEYVDGPIRGY